MHYIMYTWEMKDNNDTRDGKEKIDLFYYYKVLDVNNSINPLDTTEIYRHFHQEQQNTHSS